MRARTLGVRLRELRHSRNLTQAELARRAAVDDTYLSKIENDRLEHTPSVRTLRDLARELGVDELELMELAGKLPPLLRPFAQSEDAARFFRRAAERVRGPEEWQDLLRYLERRRTVRRRER